MTTIKIGDSISRPINDMRMSHKRLKKVEYMVNLSSD
ncbi:hypothetical protein C7972_105230 [Arenibacter sp. ARW7G5Y1]|nr:hypothetical protein C7972_105230 [Arenibacter sp. ARW7G5Y1]